MPGRVPIFASEQKYIQIFCATGCADSVQDICQIRTTWERTRGNTWGQESNGRNGVRTRRKKEDKFVKLKRGGLLSCEESRGKEERKNRKNSQWGP